MGFHEHAGMTQLMVTCRCVLPVFEGCTADTIMVVALWGPATKDCVEAVGTSVPCGVVITNPAGKKRESLTQRPDLDILKFLLQPRSQT